MSDAEQALGPRNREHWYVKQSVNQAESGH
jgi:hypothetical protein